MQGNEVIRASRPPLWHTSSATRVSEYDHCQHHTPGPHFHTLYRAPAEGRDESGNAAAAIDRFSPDRAL